MDLATKARVVRRATDKLQERAAQLAHLIPDPSSPALAPVTSNAGDLGNGHAGRGVSPMHPRMPQLRHAQASRQRRLKGAPAANPSAQAGTGAGLSAAPSNAPAPGAHTPAPAPDTEPAADDAAGSTAAGSTAGGRQYGRPPLRTPPSPTAAAFSSPPPSPPPPPGPSLTFPPAASMPIPGVSGPRPSRADFEKLVRATTDLEGMRVVYGKYCQVMVVEEFVLMTNHLASMSEPMNMSVKVWAATQNFLVELLQHITPKLDSLNMQEYVVMLAAVAKLRYVPPNDWISAVLTQSKPKLYNSSPSYLTTTLRALARIAVDPYDIKEAAAWEGWMKRYLSSVQRHLREYRGDELVKTLVALSELRYRPSAEWMTRFAGALHDQLDNLQPSALSETMLAFAALRYQPESPFLRAYYNQLYSRLPLADDRDLATFAQAAALLDRLIRQEFMHEFLAEVLQKLPTFKPAHLANLLNAMGRLAGPPTPRVRPPPGWTAAVAEHLSGAGRLRAFNGAALASMAWGLSALGHTATPKFLDDLLSASYGKMHTCGPTDMIMLLTAIGNFAYSPAPGREAFWDTWMVEFEKLAARKSYDTRGVCDLMAALARVPRPCRPVPVRAAPGDVGQQQPQQTQMVLRPPHEEFVRSVLRCTRVHSLRNTSPARLAALAGALAVMGIKPDFGFLYNYAQAARSMWAGFSMRDYATLLGALVHIGTPGVAEPRWAGDFLAITMCRMTEFDGPGLAAALDALRYLPKPEFEPSRQWLGAAAMRAVELVRPPPPPPQAAPGQAAPPAPPAPVLVHAPPGVSQAPFAPLAFRPGALQGGVTYTLSPEGRMVPVQPQQQMTPELLLVTARALAALGFRMEPGHQLASLLEALLRRNAFLLQLQTRSGAAAIAAAAAAAAADSGTPGAQTSQAVPGSAAAAAAAAAAALQRANALAAAVASGAEVPKPLLSQEAADELQGLLGTLLGMTATQVADAAVAAKAAAVKAADEAETAVAKSAAGATETESIGANVAAATMPLQGMRLPAGAERTPERKAQEQAYWEAKRKGRKAKAADGGDGGVGSTPSHGGSAQ